MSEATFYVWKRKAWYRKSRAKDQTALRMRIREIAEARPRFGYHRVYVVRRREGWRVNLKRVRWLYRLEGVAGAPARAEAPGPALPRSPVPAATVLPQRWSMDSVHSVTAPNHPADVAPAGSPTGATGACPGALRRRKESDPGTGSWLNQVEIWFNLITQKAIRRGSFRSARTLIERIRHLTEHYNAQATPFRWTATADSIRQKLERLYHAISGARH